MKLNSDILTIAIPTFNRAVSLAAQLERLIPQLRPQVRICVYDNASPDETHKVVAKYVSRGVDCFTAVTNCGAGRNIFRCFEECQTEWLWVLSDDDLASPTAVADLMVVLHNQPSDFIHASSDMFGFKSEFVVSDLPTLLNHAYFHSVLWISGGIYKVPSFRPFFRLYNESLSTWGPHMIMLFSLLESGKGKVLLSPVILATPNKAAASWSTLECILRFSLVPEYLIHPANQKLLASRIMLEWYEGAMLIGLRETTSPEQIHRWKRIGRQARHNLRAYGAQTVWGYVFKNWFRAGCRKRSWGIARNNCMIALLNRCPGALFDFFLRILPLPASCRQICAKHKGWT